MKINLMTHEEYLELKSMMQEVLTLLKEEKVENYDWTDSNGIKEMLNCSDGTLSMYRNSGLLPYTRHGGKIYYSKKALNDILLKNMTHPMN